jgi:hypothetical protein
MNFGVQVHVFLCRGVESSAAIHVTVNLAGEEYGVLLCGFPANHNSAGRLD